MATYTLLEMTQSILRSIKGEEIASITDTAESLAVADIIKECYFSLVSGKDFPELGTMFSLTASGDSTKPTLMTIPDGIVALEWIKYNAILNDATLPMWHNITYMPLKDFIQQQNGLDPADDSVETMTLNLNNDVDTFTLSLRNDKSPWFYTTYDDKTLIFDSYDSSVSTTLEQSKTSCYGYIDPPWEVSDSFIPTLDSQQVDILLKDAKAMAWSELKSIDNAMAVKTARYSRIVAEKDKFRANYRHQGYYQINYPNYGRK